MMSKKKHRVLVVGAEGMAGHIIKKYLKLNQYDVIGTTRQNVNDELYHLDVVEGIGELNTIISKYQPNIVINCIGLLNKAAEDNHDLAVHVNSYLPHYLDKLSQDNSFKLIHISTDCVFSGEKGRYEESERPDAPTFYGRSKALGEVINDKNLTIRTSIIGPDMKVGGIGLLNWYMQQTGEINGFGKAVWSGVTTLQLAKSIEQTFDKDITGLYHLVNNESINKYDLLLLLGDISNRTNVKIKRDDSYISDKSLINTRDELIVPTYSQMIQEIFKWIKIHEPDYPDFYKIT